MEYQSVSKFITTFERNSTRRQTGPRRVLRSIIPISFRAPAAPLESTSLLAASGHDWHDCFACRTWTSAERRRMQQDERAIHEAKSNGDAWPVVFDASRERSEIKITNSSE